MTKILLVEDDKSLREIYGVRLLAEGYDIVSAGDGEEALAMAIKDRPNLIVSDVMMPKISGFDMLDILRSTTETKDIKVIMMTALSSEEQRQRGVALGADRYLVKSQVGIEDVVRTVHEVLGDSLIPGGQAPLMSPRPSTPAPAAVPTMPAVAPGPGAVRDSSVPPRPTAPAPVVTPAPTPAPTPMPTAPITAPAPAPVMPSTPVAPAPVPTPVATPAAPVSHLPESVLPEPTAPFSTPRVGSMASRVIQPISANGGPETDFNHLMDKELSNAQPAMPAPVAPSAPIPAPVQSAPVAPPAPAPAAPSTGLSFEETPRPSAPAPAAPPLPPVPPAPNTGL
jgi:CheY-like chemotaxis protein